MDGNDNKTKYNNSEIINIPYVEGILRFLIRSENTIDPSCSCVPFLLSSISTAELDNSVFDVVFGIA